MSNEVTPTDLVRLTPDAGVPNIYVNDTQVQTSPWDVRFMFGLITDIRTEDRQLVIQRIADVRMSPQHAKRLLVILQSQLALYEKNVGPIPLKDADQNDEDE